MTRFTVSFSCHLQHRRRASSPASFLLYLLFAFQLFAPNRAAEVFVDDNAGSVIYSPSDSWQEGNGCSTCSLSPDAGSTFEGTWHDTTFLTDGTTRTINLTFTGVAISAYFIVPDRPQGIASVDTSLIFSLDGAQAGSYNHTPSGSSDFLYNQSLFSTSGLISSEHTLEVSASADANGGSTSVLFDYFVYTTDDNSSTATVATTSSFSPSESSISAPSSSSSSSSSPSSRSNVGAIVGGVVGGVMGSLCLLGLVLFLRRRMRKLRAQLAAETNNSLGPTEFSGSSFPSRLWKSILPSRRNSSLLTPNPAIFTEANSDSRRSTQIHGNSGRHNEKSRPLPRLDLSNVSASPQGGRHHGLSLNGDSLAHDQNLSSSDGSNPSTATMLSRVAQLQAAVISLQEQQMRGFRHVGEQDVPNFSPDINREMAPPEYSRSQ
ncbi:hypothetical protein ACEPAG_4283 [Sanghuangporus baumii]